MAWSDHPPLPSAVRPFFWGFRAAGILAGMAGLAIIVIAVSRGLWYAQLALAVAAAFTFAALGWIHPLSKWFVPALAVCGVLTVAASRSWPIGFLIMGTLGVLMWSRRPGRRLRTGVDPERIEYAEPTAVMRNAQGFVGGFEELGFAQVGALRVPIGPLTVTASLLLSPDARSYASATDAIISLTSLFPDGRSLISRNSESAPDPDYALTNHYPGASPDALFAAHDQALALVGEQGHFPLTISAPELPQIAMDGERRSIEWMNSDRPTLSQITRGQLADRPDRDDQIARWHGGIANG